MGFDRGKELDILSNSLIEAYEVYTSYGHAYAYPKEKIFITLT